MNSRRGGPVGIILGAPMTGSGKTTVVLALAALLMRHGLTVSTAKVGPDYIDPAFHAAATGRACPNIDGWAMRQETVWAVLESLAEDVDVVLVEGVMGLFDGAHDGSRVPPGSTAEIARLTGLPVVLVMNAKGLGSTAGAILAGLAGYERSINVAGVVFNGVAGDRHRDILAAAAALAQVPALGFLPRADELQLPSRHLGLVQAQEHDDLAQRLQRFADRFQAHLDVERLLALCAPVEAWRKKDVELSPLKPLGQRIAFASDAAFAFAYPATLQGWRRQGAELFPFSPLADEAPDPGADAVFLPGGYPELHAGRLAQNGRFMAGLRGAAAHGATILGECGGYMVLGEVLVDGEGREHPMAGLLPVVTSFAQPRLHLGYRDGSLLEDGPLGAKGDRFRGHEFHYASIVSQAGDRGLFQVRDALCRELGSQGRRQGSVMGSFLHLIDRT